MIDPCDAVCFATGANVWMFQEDGKISNESFVSFTVDDSDIHVFTTCFWLSMTYFKEKHNTMLSFSTEDDHSFIIAGDHDSRRYEPANSWLSSISDLVQRLSRIM